MKITIEQINYISTHVGYIVLGGACLVIALTILGLLLNFLLNFFGRKFTALWRIVEYFIYRKEFLEWVVENKKERIKPKTLYQKVKNKK